MRPKHRTPHARIIREHNGVEGADLRFHRPRPLYVYPQVSPAVYSLPLRQDPNLGRFINTPGNRFHSFFDAPFPPTRSLNCRVYVIYTRLYIVDGRYAPCFCHMHTPVFLQVSKTSNELVITGERWYILHVLLHEESPLAVQNPRVHIPEYV
jgi:hypothetical protein